MRPLSKILLPVDFSERAAAAARCARPLAEHFQSELILLHVLPTGAVPVWSGGVLLTDVHLAALVQRDLEGFLADELAGIRVTRVALDGDPAQQIVAYAHQHAVDLIVMPTHGYGPFRRFILGSNTAKVLHDADCPVWTGIHMENAPSAVAAPLHQILCALDLGPQTEKTLAWAVWLQREFGAHLTLLHAPAPIPELSDSAQESWRARVRPAIEQELTRLCRDAGCEAGLMIEPGDPAHVICSAAQRLHADALVIGRGSAAGVYGRLRTNAYAIIRQSPCPVVSV